MKVNRKDVILSKKLTGQCQYFSEKVGGPGGSERKFELRHLHQSGPRRAVKIAN